MTPASAAEPLVSICIPTHNRPDLLDLALQSALQQTYRHVEVVVSDNSDDEQTMHLVARYAAGDERIRYFRALHAPTVLLNFNHALEQARGEFVNFLMDDDLFSPTKIERMLPHLLQDEGVALVTSYRQRIDAQGALLPDMAATQRLFERDTVVGARALAEFVLENSRNVIGEPTTVLWRREDLPLPIGRCGNSPYEYRAVADVSMWLTLLAKRPRAVYLSDPLSQFRCHDAQDQRGNAVILRGMLEGLRLILDAHESLGLLSDPVKLHPLLALHTPAVLTSILKHRAEAVQTGITADELGALVQRALNHVMAVQQ